MPGPYYQSFGYLSGFLSFLAIVILNCSFPLTNISFCFTSLCLYSHYLCRECSPICLTPIQPSNSCSGSLSLRKPLCAPLLCPRWMKFASIRVPWYRMHTSLPHLPCYSDYLFMSISSADLRGGMTSYSFLFLQFLKQCT